MTTISGLGYQAGQTSYGEYEFGLRATSYSYVRFTGVSRPMTIDDSGTVTITPAAASVTPEPSSLALLATGLLGVAATRRRLVS